MARKGIKLDNFVWLIGFPKTLQGGVGVKPIVYGCVRKWVCQVGFPTVWLPMTTKITLDKAGRVLIPKSLREELHLDLGDTLVISMAAMKQIAG
jgi:AbrB family looped-hinge helix DNA binding protein